MSASGSSAQLGQANAVLSPHEGFVFVDEEIPGRFVLTHPLTLERHSLGEGSCQLNFDSEGYGYAISECDGDDSEPTVLPLEELLNRQLFTRDDGERIVLDRRMVGDQMATQWSLDLMQQRYRSTFVEITFGPMSVGCALPACCLKRPRLESRMYLSLQGVYKTLGLTSLRGEWSKWAWNGFVRWDRFLVSFGLPGQLVQSASASKCRLSMGKLADNEFPLPSVSMGGLVALLLRWCTLSPKMGGLDA